MQTIVELPEYKKQVKKHLSLLDSELLINYLAEHPKAGELMQGTGGIRKMRWAKSGTGKSGGELSTTFIMNQCHYFYFLFLEKMKKLIYLIPSVIY